VRDTCASSRLPVRCRSLRRAAAHVPPPPVPGAVEPATRPSCRVLGFRPAAGWSGAQYVSRRRVGRRAPRHTMRRALSRHTRSNSLTEHPHSLSSRLGYSPWSYSYTPPLPSHLHVGPRAHLPYLSAPPSPARPRAAPGYIATPAQAHAHPPSFPAQRSCVLLRQTATAASPSPPPGSISTTTARP
jgi:hypothetical protein